MVRHRLKELGAEQRTLAAAAQVTESYVSQLLTGKKTPPAPERTDIYDRMGAFLGLPAGNLATLADVQRREAVRRKLADPPAPLFKEVRELILRKCIPEKMPPIRTTFEKEPFGALERLVTQKLLDVVQRVTKDELRDDDWLRQVAQVGGRTDEQMRVMVLDFLEANIFNLSTDECVTFVDPLIESWDVDLVTFGVEIVLNRRLVPGPPKKFEFVERDVRSPSTAEPGLLAFLEDPSLRRDATREEITFLRRLTFAGRRPTSLYYYRALQILRDPLHFEPAAESPAATAVARRAGAESPPADTTAPRPTGRRAPKEAQTSSRSRA